MSLSRKNKYPVFVWWYSGEEYKKKSAKLAARCSEIEVNYIADNLPIDQIQKNNKKFLSLKKAVSYKRYLFKMSLQWLFDTVKNVKGPVLYLHADNIINLKPEPEIFKNAESVGYSVGLNKTAKSKMILSQGLYVSSDSLSMDFLSLLKAKAAMIQSEFPTEHDIIANTILDFTGSFNAFMKHRKYDFRQLGKLKGKYKYRQHFTNLPHPKKRFFCSGGTKDTYIQHV